MKGKGSAGAGVLIFIVVVLLGFGVCVAVCSDDDDNDSMKVQQNGLSVGPSPLRSNERRDRDRDGDDRSTGKNSRGKCEGASYCDDRDGSPTFRDSPVTICLPQSTCNWGGSQAAWSPPSNLDPQCFPYHCDPRPEGDRHV